MKATSFSVTHSVLALVIIYTLYGFQSTARHASPAIYLENKMLKDETTTSHNQKSGNHFRSKQNGVWNSISTWEQSDDKILWYAANQTPNSSSSSIVIKKEHTVTISESIDISQLVVYGNVEIIGSPLTVYLMNGEGDDIIVADGGKLKMAIGRSGGWSIQPDASWRIEAGGTYIHNSTRAISTPMNSLILEEGSNFIYLGNSDFEPSVAIAGKAYANLSFISEYGDWSLTSSWGDDPLIVYGDMTIDTGVMLDFNSHPGTIDLKGDLNVSGTFIPGNLQMNNEKTVNIEADGVLDLYSGHNIYINCTFNNKNGPSGIILRSNETTTASLIHYCEGVDATVERHVEGDWSSELAGWHLISSPVTGQNIDDFITSGEANDYDFFGWDEASNSWINQKNNDFDSWNQGNDFNTARGYLISYEKTQTDLAFKGPLQVNDVHINGLSYTENADGDPGWHLLGNPFASAIDWNDGYGWMPHNIQGQPQVWNSSMQDYEPVDIIPAMNGFMIRVADPQNGSHTGSITIPADLRLHDAGHWYKSDSGHTERIRIQVTDLDHGTAKSSTIRFHPEASSGVDRRDTYFLSGNGPGFYSLAENTRLSVNALPERYPELIIPLGFEKSRGHRFMMEVTEQIPGQDLYLYDSKHGISHKLCPEHPYPFTAADNDEPLRFEMHLQPHGMGTGITEAKAIPLVWLNGKKLQLAFLYSDPERQLEVIDISGRRLMQEHLNDDTHHSISLNIPPGIYLIRIIDRNRIMSKRFIIPHP